MTKQIKLDIYNQEGLEFLKSIEDNTVDLILTDPPYITSSDTGLDKWYDKVANLREEQRKEQAEERVRKIKRIEDKAQSENKTKEQAKEELKEEFKEEAKKARLKKQEYQDKKWDKYINSKDFNPTALDSYIDKKIKLDKSISDPRAKRDKIIASAKKNYAEYDSIYGTKYAVKTDYGTWDNDFTMVKLDDFVEEFYRVLKPNGTAIIFFDFWKITNLKKQMETKGFDQLRLIEWIKTNPQPLNSSRNYLTNCREIALTAVKKGNSTFNSKYDNGIYEYPIQGGNKDDRFHPTQKNLKMFEDLVRKHSNEGGLVLDCFLGSGTTALACMNTERSFVGCELDEIFYEKTINRVEINREKLIKGYDDAIKKAETSRKRLIENKEDTSDESTQ